MEDITLLMTRRDKEAWNNWSVDKPQWLIDLIAPLAKSNVRTALTIANFATNLKLIQSDIITILELKKIGMQIPTHLTVLADVNNYIRNFLTTTTVIDVPYTNTALPEPLGWKLKLISWAGVERWTSNSWCLKTRSHFRDYVERDGNYQIVAVRNWAEKVIPNSNTNNDTYLWGRYDRLGITITQNGSLRAAHDNYNGSMGVNDLRRLGLDTVQIFGTIQKMYQLTGTIVNNTDKINHMISKLTPDKSVVIWSDAWNNGLTQALSIAHLNGGKPNAKFRGKNLSQMMSVWIYRTKSNNLLYGVGETKSMIESAVSKGKVIEHLKV